MAYRRDVAGIGTTASVVVSRPGDLVPAMQALEHELERIDRTCSRFRADSEISLLHQAVDEAARRSGHRDVAHHKSAPRVAIRVGPELMDALVVAYRVAQLTDGLVDPTVGSCMVDLGYDRDLADVVRHPTPGDPRYAPAPGWRVVELSPESNTVRIPLGVLLDLGATAKALAVDRAVQAAHLACGGPVLVSIGGDLAVAGPVPTGGWTVGIAQSHLPRPGDELGPSVEISTGALATSSTSVRRWRRGEKEQHHIVDPRSGRPVSEVWRMVSVAAGSCVDANAASTASLVLGEKAPAWLAERGLPARLVTPSGDVVTVAGWPGVACDEP